MADPELALLSIIARVEEGEAVADFHTDKILRALTSTVGAGPLPSVSIGTSPCDDIEIFTGTDLDVFNRIVKALCFSLTTLTDDASGAVGRLLENASDALNGVIGNVEDLVEQVTAGIVDALAGVVDTIQDRLDESLEKIVSTVEGVVTRISGFVAGVVDAIREGIADTLDAIGFAINALIQAVTSAFSNLVDQTAALIERITTTVRDVGEFLTELAQATLDAMSLSVAAVLGPLVGAGESVLARLGDLVESVPGALKDAGSAVAEGIGKFVGDPLGAIGNILVTQVEEFFSKMIEEGKLSHGEVLRTLLSRLGAPADVVEKIASAADEATPTTPAFLVAALAFLVPLIIVQFLGATLDPLAQQLSQEVASAARQSLIPPTDLLDGFLKGDISETRFREDFKQAGFTDERADLLLAAFRSAPDPSVQIQAWLRDIIDEDELDGSLRANRMRPEDIALLKQVVFFVPPAQDLIRMAVREVFSPEVRERFGQDEDFPPEFANFARQQGISDVWARNYWAAHWALPSPAQGFEMLHRQVITLEDLSVLLRALDVMPFWRDKLTQIAFNPLTRVDLRRMHALGLLTDAELQTRYESLGFNADDAELMVTFTVAFNASGEELPNELEGLTRTSVLNMFEDGLIERAAAVEFLAQAGIGSEAAELFVEHRELEVSRRDRRDLIESVVSLAGGGRISLPQAEDSLAQIGITAIETTRAIGRILSRRESRDRLPSLASLEKMRGAGILDDEEFLEALKASGFDDTWAARHFELIVGEEPA